MNKQNEGAVTVDDQTFKVKCSADKMKRYIIDAKWWSKWCDYCNFDQNDLIID